MHRVTATVTVTDATEQRRYEARMDGQLAAVAAYIPTEELLAFTHTEVYPAFEHQGVGSALVRGALDDVRARHLKALPVCPFVTGFLGRHWEEYGDVVYRSTTTTVAD